jgi:hypothetical protein
MRRGMTVIQMAAKLLVAKGEAAAFLRSFDSAPDDDDVDTELYTDRLGRDDARDLLHERAESGFIGLLTFSCLELRYP